jgi:hypothetical protein
MVSAAPSSLDGNAGLLVAARAVVVALRELTVRCEARRAAPHEFEDEKAIIDNALIMIWFVLDRWTGASASKNDLIIMHQFRYAWSVALPRHFATHKNAHQPRNFLWTPFVFIRSVFGYHAAKILAIRVLGLILEQLEQGEFAFLPTSWGVARHSLWYTLCFWRVNDPVTLTDLQRLGSSAPRFPRGDNAIATLSTHGSNYTKAMAGLDERVGAYRPKPLTQLVYVWMPSLCDVVTWIVLLAFAVISFMDPFK